MCKDCNICIQWARYDPQDWEVVPASLWQSTPNRGIPTRQGGFDNAPGWIQSICVQGIEFENYDHYAVQYTDDALIVTQWSDDFRDFPIDEFVAMVWTIRHLAPDSKYPLDINKPELGGRYNTRQSVEYFVGSTVRDKFLDNGRLPELTIAVNDWSDFVPPPSHLIRHGVWLPGDANKNSLYMKHKKVRHGLRWENWTKGVPVDRIVNGRAR